MSGQVAQVEQKVKHNKHQGKVRLPRVAIISSERYPHHDTNTQQIIKNANAMSAAGLQVELVVPVQYKGFFKQNYDLSNAIYREIGLSLSESSNLVDAFIEEIATAMAKGEQVKLSSFGTF